MQIPGEAVNHEVTPLNMLPWLEMKRGALGTWWGQESLCGPPTHLGEGNAESPWENLSHVPWQLHQMATKNSLHWASLFHWGILGTWFSGMWMTQLKITQWFPFPETGSELFTQSWWTQSALLLFLISNKAALIPLSWWIGIMFQCPHWVFSRALYVIVSLSWKGLPKALSCNLMVPQLPISLSEVSLKPRLSLSGPHNRCLG